MKNIFDWLNEITYKKSHPDSFTEQDWETWNSYMVHRFISMNPYYTELANYIQAFPPTEKKQIYTVYRELVPKRKVFLRYIKSKKKEDWGDIIKLVSEYFMCSIKEAKNYIPLLGKEGIGNLLSEIGTDEKEKKKLLKKIKVDG